MTTLKPFGSAAPAVVRCSLADTNIEVCRALAEAFRAVSGVEVVCGNLLDLPCDGVVSPANSFGDMDGGIDKAIDDFHGGDAQRRVMAAISDRFLGELPVGAALVVAAPTMRVPGSVVGTINAYLAMRVALVVVAKHNEVAERKIARLAIPGLCTGIGAMPYEEAASQMRAAYDNVLGGKWRDVVHASQAPFADR